VLSINPVYMIDFIFYYTHNFYYPTYNTPLVGGSTSPHPVIPTGLIMQRVRTAGGVIGTADACLHMECFHLLSVRFQVNCSVLTTSGRFSSIEYAASQQMISYLFVPLVLEYYPFQTDVLQLTYRVSVAPRCHIWGYRVGDSSRFQNIMSNVPGSTEFIRSSAVIDTTLK